MGWVCLSVCWDTPPDQAPPGVYTPQSRHPPDQAPPQTRHPPRPGTPPDQAPPRPGTPPDQAPRSSACWEIGQRAGGMHPTGMQSCLHLLSTSPFLHSLQMDSVKWSCLHITLRQECIPVGCELPASVAVPGGGCLPGWVPVQGEGVCPRGCLPGGCLPHNPCENTTFS